MTAKPMPPARAAGMRERIVRFAGGADGRGDALEGVLRMPAMAGPTPAVLLIHGSMEHDRDGNLLRTRAWLPPAPRRDFFVHIARHLCAAGFATFSYDRRGYGASRGEPGDYFTDADDALAALGAMAAEPEVDRTRLAVFGQSAGVYTASLIAPRTRLPALYILSGGLYSDYRDMMSFNYHRARDFARRSPEHLAWAEEHDPWGVALGIHLNDVFRALDDGAGRYVVEYKGRSWSIDLDPRIYSEEWSPARQIRHIDRPTLVVHGDNDLNVPPRDALGIVDELRRRDVPAELRMIAGADHSFHQTPPDYETRVRERMSLASFLRPHCEEYFACIVDFLGRWFGCADRRAHTPPPIEGERCYA